MKLATWNIYWLGDKTKSHIDRGDDDEELISQVLSDLSPGVIALQEIVDPVALSRVLAYTQRDDYRLVMENDDLPLTSSADPEDEHQKVFLCFDKEAVEIISASPIEGGPWGRRPIAAHLREKSSGAEFTVVALHLRSGYPNFLDEKDAANRRKQCAAVAAWLRGEAKQQNPELPEPPTDDVALLGASML